MAAYKRRKSPSTALSVENALWFRAHAGTAAAAEYLLYKGISIDVVERVLSTKDRRRRRWDRRILARD